MALATVYLTPEAEAYLKLYGLSTHGIALPAAVAKELTEAGFVEQRPSPVLKMEIYGLTEAGAIFQDEQLGGAHDDRR